jgi:MFS family permease
MAETKPPSLRPYRPALVFSFTNALTWMIVLGTPMILLGEWLGANAFIIGMAYAALYLSLPVQVIFTATLHRFGYKKQMIFCWGARGIAAVVMLIMTWMAHDGPQPWMRYAYIACAWHFCLFRAAGNSSVTPWMYEFIPPEVRGRYFAIDQTVSSICGVMILISAACLFAAFTPFSAFMLCMVISIVGSAASTVSLFYWPDCPKPAPVSLTDMAKRIPKLFFAPSPYRTYLIVTTLWWLVISPLNPFSSYYLKTEGHLSQSLVIIYSAYQYSGVLLGALWTSRHLDKWGVRPFFALSLGCYTLLGVYWILLVLGVPMVVHFAAASFFVLGLSNAFFYSPNFKYLPQVCPSDDQPLALAVNLASTGVAAGLSPIVGGFFVKHLDGTPGMLKTPFLIYLGILLVVQLALFAPFWRLKETGNTNPPLPSFMQFHIRFTRYASSILSYAGMERKPNATERKETK